MMLSMSKSEKVKSRITITIDPEILEKVQALVTEDIYRSVSAFFEYAALDMLDADAAFDRMIDEMLEETGGPMTDEEREETERELGYRA